MLLFFLAVSKASQENYIGFLRQENKQRRVNSTGTFWCVSYFLKRLCNMYLESNNKTGRKKVEFKLLGIYLHC